MGCYIHDKYDQIPTESDDVLPNRSTIGRGPKGDSIHAQIIPNSYEDVRIKITDDDGNEYISENLSNGLISVSATNNRTAGSLNEITVTAQKTGQQVKVPVASGVPGSFIYAVKTSEELEQGHYKYTFQKESTNAYSIPLEYIQGNSEYDSVNIKPGDIILFYTYTSANTNYKYYLSCGVVRNIIDNEYLSVACDSYMLSMDHKIGGDYNTLVNQPSINNHTLIGNKSSEDLGLASITALSNETLQRQLEDQVLDGKIITEATTRAEADTSLEQNKVNKTTKVNGHALSGDVTVTKGDVGLGNVDNTSDANKPISTATQTALNNKLDKVTTTTGGSQLYAKLPNGNQSMISIDSGASNGTIMYRTSDGRSKVANPVDDLDIINKQTMNSSLSNKLDKASGTTKVYIKDANGDDKTAVYADSNYSAWTFPYRGGTGTFQVGNATDNQHPATLGQMNTALSTKQNTLTAGSNISISNNTISSTDTTYTAGSGLSLNNKVFSLDSTTQTALTNLSNRLGTLETYFTNLVGKVNSIFVTADFSIDPKNLFGGTWVRLEDAVIRAGSTAGTGGSDTYRILKTDLPRHRHAITTYMASNNSWYAKEQAGAIRANDQHITHASEASEYHSIANGGMSEGSGIVNGQWITEDYPTLDDTQSDIDTLPYYISLAVWKRTAL